MREWSPMHTVGYFDPTSRPRMTCGSCRAQAWVLNDMTGFCKRCYDQMTDTLIDEELLAALYLVRITGAEDRPFAKYYDEVIKPRYVDDEHYRDSMY